jgi:hypothetical protein
LKEPTSVGTRGTAESGGSCPSATLLSPTLP